MIFYYNKKILILFIIFYILTLFQNAFLIHFNIKGIIPNFVLILVFFLNFFEKPGQYFGFWAALFGGFLLDIFSDHYFGLSIIIFLIISFFVKKSLHFLKERQIQKPLVYFLPLLFFSLIVYKLFFLLVFSISYSHFSFQITLNTLIEILYNFILGFLIFCLYKIYKIKYGEIS